MSLAKSMAWMPCQLFHNHDIMLKLSAQHVNCAANEHDNYWHYLFNILAERIEVCRQTCSVLNLFTRQRRWKTFVDRKSGIRGTTIMTDGHVVDDFSFYNY